jgi:hypothetical protein
MTMRKLIPAACTIPFSGITYARRSRELQAFYMDRFC